MGEMQVLMEMGHGCHNSAQGVVYYEQSLIIRREVSDLVGEAACLEHLGLLQTYLGNTQVCLLPAMFKAKNVGLCAYDLQSLQYWIFCSFLWRCVRSDAWGPWLRRSQRIGHDLKLLRGLGYIKSPICLHCFWHVKMRSALLSGH